MTLSGMQRLAPLIACVALLRGVAPVGAYAAESAPLAVFGRLPTLEDVARSPSGERIAFVKTQADDRLLGVMRLGDPKPLGVMRVGDAKLRSLKWLDEDNLLLTYTDTSLPPIGFFGARREWTFLAIYSLATHRTVPVSFEIRDQRTFNTVTGEPMVRVLGGKTMLFAPGWYVDYTTLPALFEIGATGRGARILAHARDQFCTWIVDQTGAIAATLAYHERPRRRRRLGSGEHRNSGHRRLHRRRRGAHRALSRAWRFRMAAGGFAERCRRRAARARRDVRIGHRRAHFQPHHRRRARHRRETLRVLRSAAAVALGRDRQRVFRGTGPAGVALRRFLQDHHRGVRCAPRVRVPAHRLGDGSCAPHRRRVCGSAGDRRCEVDRIRRRRRHGGPSLSHAACRSS